MREFQVKAIKTDCRDGKPIMMVCMDLETYNEALESFLDHLADESFNSGFEAGQNPYPTEEEIADMDNDRTSDDS